MRNLAAYHRHSIFSPPDWRWGRVLQLCDRVPRPGRCSARDDAYTRGGRNFLLRWRNRAADEPGREELFFECPGLYYAHEIHERASEEPEAEHILQARLLARQTAADIGRTMGLTPETVEWYARLFFDVADRIEQKDWIAKQVLLPAALRNYGLAGRKPEEADDDAEDARPSDWIAARNRPYAQPFFDLTLKLFAYFGGPFVVDFMITGFQSGKIVSNLDNVPRFFEEHMALTLKRRSAQAAMTFEVNKFNVMELFAVTTSIINLERTAETEDTARNTIEQHIQALVKEIPWTVGQVEDDAPPAGRLGRYDDAAAELRDDEVLLAAAGEEPEALRGLELQVLPPPHKVKEAAVKAAADED